VARAAISNSVFTGNDAGERGFAIYGDYATVDISETLIAKNGVSSGSGALWFYGCSSRVTNSTVTDNVGAGIIIQSGTAKLLNTISRGAPGVHRYSTNTTPGSAAFVEARYCNINPVWTGTGNIDTDPLFVNAQASDYRLKAESPCVDAGDPSSPNDADGTRADIGVSNSALTGRRLELPKLRTLAGANLTVPIAASFTATSGMNFAFLADASLLTPVEPFVVVHAFEGSADALALANVVGDTVFVSLSAGEPMNLDNGVLAELAFRVADSVPLGTKTSLTWLPYPMSNIGENEAVLVNGRLLIGNEPYGDITDDGSISAQDASEVLKYLVRLVPSINEKRADVSGNGYISGQDASLILKRAIDPTLVFPVEEQELNERPSITKNVEVTWVAENGAWRLAADDAIGVESGELILSFHTVASLQISGPDLIESRWEGKKLHVAFVRLPSSSNILLSLSSPVPLSAPPEIASIRLNEDQITASLAARAGMFELEQNQPNPFNPSTSIGFSIPAESPVHLAIYAIDGRMVRVLVDGSLRPGRHEIAWDGTDMNGSSMASGVYVCRLVAGSHATVRRMVLVR
jgi:hypothetical protein